MVGEGKAHTGHGKDYKVPNLTPLPAVGPKAAGLMLTMLTDAPLSDWRPDAAPEVPLLDTLPSCAGQIVMLHWSRSSLPPSARYCMRPSLPSRSLM